MYFKSRRQAVLKLAMIAHLRTRVCQRYFHTRLESRLCLKTFGQNSHKAKIRTRARPTFFYL